MFRRNTKSRKYQAPLAKETPVVFENNFCATVRFNIQVQDYDNVNAHQDWAAEGEYFEDIIS
ncbi:MAG: hypothetical protein IKH49_07385 [Bacteroidales bacterium]|nr:hypothetical protein [Bacteroidales bacterium]